MTDLTTIAVLPDSHVDHGLTPDQLAWLVKRAEEQLLLYVPHTHDPAPAVLKLTLRLPTALGQVPCGLHGPVMGDAAVTESEVTYAVRGSRDGQSRLVDRAPVLTSKVSLIAGEYAGQRWVLYTVFGGPSTPREPWDASLADDPVAQTESDDFWHVHALSV